MNYDLHYNKLIQRAKIRSVAGYVEKHHILPKCMGGTDDPANLVNLTAREHFIAHLLLVKIYPQKYSLIKAVNMMCMANPRQDRSMNRMYGWLKEKFSDEISRSQSGTGNSQHGLMWIHNIDLKQNKKVYKNTKIPSGWQKGRIVNFDLWLLKQEEIRQRRNQKLEKQKEKIAQQECIRSLAQQEKKKSQIETKNYIVGLYEEFKLGNYYSVKEFHKINDIKVSRMTISKYWRKYIPEYKENSKEGKRFRI